MILARLSLSACVCPWSMVCVSSFLFLFLVFPTTWVLGMMLAILSVLDRGKENYTGEADRLLEWYMVHTVLGTGRYLLLVFGVCVWVCVCVRMITCWMQMKWMGWEDGRKDGDCCMARW